MGSTGYDSEGAVFRAEFDSTVVMNRNGYNFGTGLVHDQTKNMVSVDASDKVAPGDMRPVTSNAVSVEVGNIEILLKTL